MRQIVRATIQLSISELAALMHQPDPVWCPRHLRLEQLVNALPIRKRA
jgi:hypothetical protein